MNITIEISSSKYEMRGLDTDELDFKGHNDTNEYKYSFNFVMNVFEVDECYEPKNKVAKIEGYIFDEEKCDEDGIDIVEAADMLYQEIYEAMFALYNSKIYNKEKTDDLNYYFPPYQCYLSRFYVFPEYRKKGLGKYLLVNLSDILDEIFNIGIGFIIAFINPLTLDGVKWTEYKDKNNEMRDYMRQFFINNGYNKHGRSKYYIKKCF